MTNLIPAEPGYVYIELDEYEDRYEVRCRHPVIAWMLANDGAYHALSLLPIVLMHREDESEWGVAYPDGRVVDKHGDTYPNGSSWVSDCTEVLLQRRKREAEREAKKAPPLT